MQGQTQVSKKNDGLLAYQSNSTAPVSQVLYNTISTPRGGQFEVALPDGTKVWLNAASSLRFPTAFTGKERDVELTGEAYFEVAKNKDLPFHVTSAGQVIEVLGTHFNINAYTDEKSIKTTLFEGSVRVAKNLKSAMLKPGEQSIVSNDDANTIRIADDVDADEVLAWKNGKFYFNDADVETVMRQVSRWYDVDIEYKGKSSADRFTGNFTRDLNLSKTLKLLEFTGINFKIEGRKIIVQ
jgi:transmembrane sensor